jgi:hypothetical protein
MARLALPVLTRRGLVTSVSATSESSSNLQTKPHKCRLFKSIETSKNIASRAGDMAQGVEHLPSKHKPLISNPSTVKTNKQQQNPSQ